jgi:hypothetical protein
MKGSAKKLERMGSEERPSAPAILGNAKAGRRNGRRKTPTTRFGDLALVRWGKASLHTIGSYISHWLAAGAILVISGFTPDHWVARIAQGLYDAWNDIDGRFAVVLIGVTIIVGDLLHSRHKR